MAFLILLLIIIEVLTFTVIRHHFLNRLVFSIAGLANLILSIWFWTLVFRIAGYDSFFDNPDFVWLLMALAGTITGVIMPRILLIILHFAGWFIRRKDGDHIRWITNIGFLVAVVFLTVTLTGTMHGRFNFKTEAVSAEIRGLHPDLEGMRIVHISDLHLSGFYRHSQKLEEAMAIIGELDPDIIINTGDFVTFGWREYERYNTILSRATGRYGNFAVMGNHDGGRYHPEYTEADIGNNVLNLNRMITSSGYTVLNDEHILIKIGQAKLAVIGVTTGGRHPNIIHGDLDMASSGLDTADLRILLTHDPNHWIKSVSGKRSDISLTLSGHTHGMQMGIMTKNIRWSPSKYYYPQWNGLYSNGDQLQYVNRGLGVLAMPFRIWMPPEITIITLKRKD